MFLLVIIFTFDDSNLNNWNKYPISPLITVSLDNGPQSE